MELACVLWYTLKESVASKTSPAASEALIRQALGSNTEIPRSLQRFVTWYNNSDNGKRGGGEKSKL